MIVRSSSPDAPDRPAWPECGTWDLDHFFRELREDVIGLEQAWLDGSLAARLADEGLFGRIGPDLLTTYEALARRRPGGDLERRRETVLALLDQLHAEVFQVDVWGAIGRAPIRNAPSGLFLTSIGAGTPVVQRLDQIVSRRFWGIGFVGDEPSVADEISRMAVRDGVTRLARDLTDLARVLQRPARGVQALIPSHDDRRFERLMLDILDENQPRARPARLREDFCQKTDLRVRYPGLGRPRGARVQVKATANLARHTERIADIRHQDQLVILSPVRIAEFVDTLLHLPAAERPLTADDLRAFWDSLPDRPAALADLAYSIKEVLWRGLYEPRVDPRGPMASVPAPMRRVVRAYVRAEAFRSTAAMRAHELRHGGARQRADGRLIFGARRPTLDDGARAAETGS